MPVKRRGLTSNRRHCNRAAQRWRNRLTSRPTRVSTNCGNCYYFVPTTGSFRDEWGACSNPRSEDDGSAVDEHYGCDQFQETGASKPYEDTRHFDATHEQWGHTFTKNTEYRHEQCGGCRFYIRLEGCFFTDWGMCSNQNSSHDGSVMFEHSGCEQYEQASGGWGAVIPKAHILRVAKEQEDRLSENERDTD